MQYSSSKAMYITPPIIPKDNRPSVFLARSIEMDDISDFNSTLSRLPITILDPCRDDWDCSWRNIYDPKFIEQTEWEIQQLEKADVIILFFHPGTMDGSKLLELGLYAKDRKTVVFCPNGYSMKAYLQIICRKYNIPLLETRDELKEFTKTKLDEIVECGMETRDGLKKEFTKTKLETIIEE
jgi:hypothetical protein